MDDADRRLCRLAMKIQYRCQQFFFGEMAFNYFEGQNVNVLFSAKSSEVPVFTGISTFQQNLRFFKFNFWGCYQAAVDRSFPTSIPLILGNSCA